VPPEEGIQRTVDWMRSYYRLDERARRLDAIPISAR
jgi:hypothetical protein